MRIKKPKKPKAPKKPLEKVPMKNVLVEDCDFEGTLQDLIDKVPEGVSYSDVQIYVEGQNYNGADFEVYYWQEVDNPNLKEQMAKYNSEFSAYGNKMNAYKTETIKYNEERVKELEKELRELKK